MEKYNYQNYNEDPYEDDYYDDEGYYGDEDEYYEDDEYYNNEDDYFIDNKYYEDYDYEMDYDYENSIQNIYRFDNKKSFTEIINSEINPSPMSYIPQSHLNILMIAEKPSIARTISKILCIGTEIPIKIFLLNMVGVIIHFKGISKEEKPVS